MIQLISKRMSIATAFFSIMPMLGCQSAARPLPTMDHVDLERFSGDWYVLAAIPTPLERNIFNAKERYEWDGEARVNTTFTFNKGSLDGPERQFQPTAFVADDGSNALWGMQFLWPFRAEYRIAHVDPDYRYTIVGRTKRDYVWVMSRSPEVSDERYSELLRRVQGLGYNLDDIVRIPHG